MHNKWSLGQWKYFIRVTQHFKMAAGEERLKAVNARAQWIELCARLRAIDSCIVLLYFCVLDAVREAYSAPPNGSMFSARRCLHCSFDCHLPYIFFCLFEDPTQALIRSLYVLCLHKGPFPACQKQAGLHIAIVH